MRTNRMQLLGQVRKIVWTLQAYYALNPLAIAICQSSSSMSLVVAMIVASRSDDRESESDASSSFVMMMRGLQRREREKEMQSVVDDSQKVLVSCCQHFVVIALDVRRVEPSWM